MPSYDYTTSWQKATSAANSFLKERAPKTSEEQAADQARLALEMSALHQDAQAQVQLAVNGLVVPHGNFSGGYDHDVTLVAYQSQATRDALLAMVGDAGSAKKLEVAHVEGDINGITGGKIRLRDIQHT